MYVCGPTVYDVPHIGHGRSVLVFDILRRYLEWCGLGVDHVANVTDVDDKIIQRANAEGRSESDVAEQYEAAWWEAMDRLGALRPTSIPHATQYMERMVALVAELMERGLAYEAPDGVYLDLTKVAGYGLLAHQPLDSLRAGARVEIDSAKRSPMDFAVWKKAKPGEPTWPSPWGPGRPGWHTECVVMSLDLLGEDFDLHGGGLDLIFPHHENERAQATALGKQLTRHWMHHGLVETGGEKMSKSLGNFTSLVDLLDRTDPRAYRLAVLQSHYRSPMEVTPATIGQAEASLQRLDSLARRFPPNPATDQQGDQASLTRFRELMDDDLNTTAVTGLLFDLVRNANALADKGDPEGAGKLAATVAQITEALGLQPAEEDVQIDPETADLMEQRDQARRVGDFAKADAIRMQLEAMGWTLEDGPEGTKIRR